jgi:hypothetical protein
MVKIRMDYYRSVVRLVFTYGANGPWARVTKLRAAEFLSKNILLVAEKDYGL